MPKQTKLVPKRLVYFIYEGILNTRGGYAFFMGAENAKMKSAEKSAETGGHRLILVVKFVPSNFWAAFTTPVSAVAFALLIWKTKRLTNSLASVRSVSMANCMNTARPCHSSDLLSSRPMQGKRGRIRFDFSFPNHIAQRIIGRRTG